MAEPYDLRSNIKGKPGSQGTLFQVKDKGLLNPQQRWPKGYTPERQAEVKSALKNTTITGGPVQRVTPEESERTGRYARYPSAEARVTDAIARSTMPSSDLRGLKHLTAIHDQPAPGTSGTYWPRRREIGVDMHRGEIQGSTADEDLIHEIGHHMDLRDRSTEDHLASAHGVKGIGLEGHSHWKGTSEAVADNYAMAHFRTQGRNPQHRQGDAIYERRGNAERLPGYTDVRPQQQPHMGPQFKQEHLF